MSTYVPSRTPGCPGSIVVPLVVAVAYTCSIAGWNANAGVSSAAATEVFSLKITSSGS